MKAQHELRQIALDKALGMSWVGQPITADQAIEAAQKFERFLRTGKGPKPVTTDGEPKELRGADAQDT